MKTKTTHRTPTIWFAPERVTQIVGWRSNGTPVYETTSPQHPGAFAQGQTADQSVRGFICVLEALRMDRQIARSAPKGGA